MPDNRPFIIAAYAVTWLCLVAYALLLRSARKDAEHRLATARKTTGGDA
jgi:CcmD family protein